MQSHRRIRAAALALIRSFTRPVWPELTWVESERSRIFPERVLTAQEATALGYGQRIPATGVPGLHAAVDPDGRLAALVEDAGSTARVAVGFPPS